MISRLIKKRIINKKWRKRNPHNTTFLSNVESLDYVKVGNGTYGEINAFISNRKQKLIIGNYCSIANNVTFIVSGEHNLSTLSTFPFEAQTFGCSLIAGSKGDIIIEDDVWIGMNSTILSGIKIGQGAVIAAGSVVTKDVPPYSIVAGNPAKIIKYRFSNNIIEKLINIDYNKLNQNFIKNNRKLFLMDITEENIDEIIKKIKEIE